MQAPLPLQTSRVKHSPSGSVFARTKPHSPVGELVSMPLQDLHSRLHGSAQQTLSPAGQDPLKHWPGWLQGTPCAFFGVQAPSSQ